MASIDPALPKTTGSSTGMDPSYHDRLAQHWPEPRDQLHAGGWAATEEMVEILGLKSANLALDVCCGEGGTAVYLARKYDRRIIGVDLIESAISAAHRSAIDVKAASFAVADVFQLPFADNQFDVIYGQDPDGFAFEPRIIAFGECHRLLRPGGTIGLQHWLLHDDVSTEHALAYERACADMGFPKMRRLRAGEYVQDLQAAGFEDVTVEDLSEVYKQHLLRLANRSIADGCAVDRWTAISLKIIKESGKIGVRIRARKPM